jgi:hypothetical protein
MWKCRRRWNRPVTRSIATPKLQLVLKGVYLSAAIARKRVVPQSLMRASQWLLVMINVAMGSNSRSKAHKSWSEPHLAKYVFVEEGMKELESGNLAGRHGKLR